MTDDEITSDDIDEGAADFKLDRVEHRMQIAYILMLEKRIEAMEEMIQAMRVTLGCVIQNEQDDD